MAAVLHREIDAARIDRRRHDRDAHALRLAAEHLQLVGIADVERHRGGEEFDRIVGLEIGGLIGDDGVGGGMRLVEAVAREFRAPARRSSRRGNGSIPLASAPLTKRSFCSSISDLIFLPIARRRTSASLSE